MEKLEHLRKMCLLRVNGVLTAAGTLAERNASHCEATDRLQRLQELAGKFRRVQQEMEENMDDPEAVLKTSEEFFTAYQAAKELLEKHIINSKPVRAVSRKDSSGSLLEEIKNFCAEAQAWSAAQNGQFVTGSKGFGDSNGRLPAINGAVFHVPTKTVQGQSGAAESGDPDGEQLSSCASAQSVPTVSSESEIGPEDGCPISNRLPQLAEHSVIEITTACSGQATSDGERDGPETSNEDFEKASAEEETTQNKSGMLPEQQNATTITTESRDPEEAQRKAHIIPTATDSVRGIDEALLQASLGSKICGQLDVPRTSDKVVNTGIRHETLVKQQDAELCVKREHECYGSEDLLEPDDQAGCPKAKRVNQDIETTAPNANGNLRSDSEAFSCLRKRKIQEKHPSVLEKDFATWVSERSKYYYLNMALQRDQALTKITGDRKRRHFRDATFSYKVLWIREHQQPFGAAHTTKI